ncbi:MAG: GNAT family N-acetyltransferase, partial [Chloroflexota bacterium]
SFKHRGVLGMGVAKDYRGMGLGERLARATISQAHLHRLERVELLVFGANLRARKLYGKLGFIEEETKKNARKLDGVYDDVIEMVLFLEDYVA